MRGCIEHHRRDPSVARAHRERFTTSGRATVTGITRVGRLEGVRTRIEWALCRRARTKHLRRPCCSAAASAGSIREKVVGNRAGSSGRGHSGCVVRRGTSDLRASPGPASCGVMHDCRSGASNLVHGQRLACRRHWNVA